MDLGVASSKPSSAQASRGIWLTAKPDAGLCSPPDGNDRPRTHRQGGSGCALLPDTYGPTNRSSQSSQR